MATLKIYSFEYERYNGLTVLATSQVIPTFPIETPKSATLNAPSPGVLQAEFNNLALNKDWFFWIKESNTILWRSGAIRITNINQVIELRLFTINEDQTTFTEDDLEEEVDLPITQKVFPDDENSKKMISIEDININIRTNDLRLTGSGILGDENDDGEIQVESNFTFIYTIRLEPSSLVTSTKRFINVNPVEDPQLNFDNIITGIIVGIFNFFTGEVNKKLERAVERNLNKSIQQQLESQLNDVNEETAERVIATIQDIQLEDGDKLIMTTVLNMPSELFVEQVNKGCGSKAASLLILLMVLLWWLF